MHHDDRLGPWVRRFLLEYLVGERQVAENTRRSYRDALALLIPFVATSTRTPVDRAWCTDICGILFKKTAHEGICYLEKHEMDALLAAPDKDSRQGFRDHTLLLFLYNSGARASEAVSVTVGDLDIPNAQQASVRLMGKGSKVRRCPLWASTAAALKMLIADRQPQTHVFLNRRAQPLTR